MIIGVLCRRVARLRCGAVKFDFAGKADFSGRDGGTENLAVVDER